LPFEVTETLSKITLIATNIYYSPYEMRELRKAHDGTFDSWIRLALLIVALYQLLYIAEIWKTSSVLYIRESGDLLAECIGGTFKERGK